MSTLKCHTLLRWKFVVEWGGNFGQKGHMKVMRDWIRPLRQMSGIFLAGLLFLQSAMAFGGASVFAGENGIQIVICGANGVQTVTIDADGNLIDEAGGEGAPSTTGHCPFCIVGPALEIASPGVVPRSVDYVYVSYQVPQDFAAPLECRVRGHDIRAPPISL